MRMWLLSLAPHSLSAHDHGPPSPTARTTTGTAARTAPLSPTQYVTNDCGCASFSTTDAALQRLRETFADSVKACCWRCARCIQSEALLSAFTNTFCIRANRTRAKRYQNTRSRAPNSHTKCVLRAHHNCVREDRTTERHGTRMQKRKHKITTSKRLTCSNGSCACLHTE